MGQNAGISGRVAWRWFRFLSAFGWLLGGSEVSADPRYYDPGTPVLQDLWVDPVSGSNANSGATRGQALATITEAWSRVPRATVLSSTGYRLRLVAGTYPSSIVPNYWEERWGTAQFPIVIEAADGAGTAILPSLNIFDTRYLYLIGLDIRAAGGDVLHCEKCDHFLVKNSRILGTTTAVQEVIKVNQSTHFYLEDSEVDGGWDNAVDCVGVNYGHFQGNRIHGSGDWCAYVKGGSGYFRVEGNEFYDCGTGGFTAGQGTGFEFMDAPWLHHEAHDVKVINNVVHDTEGAAFGVNGGYNILLAHNTAYRIGSRSHVFEAVFGERGCDGNTSACQARLALGGWGTTVSYPPQYVPNRNVYVYNNVFLNPAPFQSQWQHLAIYGPRSTSSASNIPSPARSDVNLQFRGNVIWNASASHPLGIEDGSEGCAPTNPTCNETQLRAENTFHSLLPQLVDPAGGDFRPVEGGNLFSATTYAIPDFPGDDRPSPPLAPLGDLTNGVLRDFDAFPRSSSSPPGAFGRDCTAAVCGDGTAVAGCEECDDGNLTSGDGCDANCRPTGCGNGVVTEGETCDDGNSSNLDACRNDCEPNVCGDGFVQAGVETCDDGNLVDFDGCQADCSLLPARDVVLTPPAPLVVRLKAGSPAITKKVNLSLRNADLPGTAPQVLALDTVSDCPVGTLVSVDMNAATPTLDSTLTLAPRRTARARLTLSFDPASFTSGSLRSPHRCRIAITAQASDASGNYDPQPANNAAPLEISVFDAGDPAPEGAETYLDSLNPVAVTLPRVAGPAAVRKVKLKMGNGAVGTGSEAVSVSLSDGDCPPGTLATVDLDSTTPGNQASVLVTRGKSRTGVVNLSISATSFRSASLQSPDRCVATLSISSAGSGSVTNDTARLVIGVVDRSDH